MKEDWLKNVLKVGDWVEIYDEHELSGFIGFLLDVDHYGDEYTVRITTGPSGKRYNGLFYARASELVLIDEIRENEDLQLLIDIALAKNDKEWFMELSNKLPLRM